MWRRDTSSGQDKHNSTAAVATNARQGGKGQIAHDRALGLALRPLHLHKFGKQEQGEQASQGLAGCCTISCVAPAVPLAACNTDRRQCHLGTHHAAERQAALAHSLHTDEETQEEV